MSYGTAPCPICEGHGFRPDGYQCHECNGTGREWGRHTSGYCPEPGEEETIHVKVAHEVHQAIEWEKEARRKELEGLPELKAAVEAVEEIARYEAEFNRQFRACKGPLYEAWKKEEEERKRQEYDNEMVIVLLEDDEGNEYQEEMTSREADIRLARQREARLRREAENSATDAQGDQRVLADD